MLNIRERAIAIVKILVKSIVFAQKYIYSQMFLKISSIWAWNVS